MNFSDMSEKGPEMRMEMQVKTFLHHRWQFSMIIWWWCDDDNRNVSWKLFPHIGTPERNFHNYVEGDADDGKVMVVMTMILEIMMTMMLKMKTMKTMTIEKTRVFSVTVVNQPLFPMRPFQLTLRRITLLLFEKMDFSLPFGRKLWTFQQNHRHGSNFYPLIQCNVAFGTNKSLKACWTDIVAEKITDMRPFQLWHCGE